MAVYVSAHGMGHAVRVAAVLSRLQARFTLSLSVAAAVAPSAWPSDLAGDVDQWRREPCDAGVVQSDDVTVDVPATTAALGRWLAGLEAIVDREALRLRGGFDLVVGDVPSPVFEAARLAGIPSVAVANFSWDWIYSELGFDDCAAAASRGYRNADLLLEATPCAPMRAFPRRVPVGLVARRATRTRDAARADLGLPGPATVGLLAFQAASAPAVALPPPRDGRLWLAPTGWPAVAARPDLVQIPAGFPFADAVAASDVVVGKPGYGLLSDIGAAGAPFLFVPRPGFPENTVLVDHLLSRGGAVAITTRDLAVGKWEDSFVALAEGPRPTPERADGAERAAEAIARLLVDSGRGKV